MAFRTAAARPKRAVPTSSSFAESGTECGTITAAGGSTAARLTSTDEATAADWIATDVPDAPDASTAVTLLTERCRSRAGPDDDSSDNANPTGTTRAATIAASNNTRYRFRIPSTLRSTHSNRFASSPDVDRSTRARVKLQAMCHARRVRDRRPLRRFASCSRNNITVCRERRRACDVVLRSTNRCCAHEVYLNRELGSCCP
jgi:hypothetical protein